MTQDLQEYLIATVEQALDEFQVPGAAIAVIIDGRTFLETGIGYQDSQQQVSLPADTNFYIYSITKSLIAVAFVYLVEKGILVLDASVRPYLDDFPLDPSITFRQLLSHTSGLPDYGGVSAYTDAVRTNPRIPWTREMFLALAYNQGLQITPGKGWAYSNIGYLLLKCLLEQITGLSLQQFFNQVIFNPLSLKKTYVPTFLNDIDGLTPGYTTFFEDELQDMSCLYHPRWVAHGVVISTAPELAGIVDALFTGKLLTLSSVKQMTSPIHTLGKYPLFENLGYGLGLFVDTGSPYGEVAGHTGEGPGYSAAAFHFPNLAGARTTIVALANRDRCDLGLALVYKMVNLIARY